MIEVDRTLASTFAGLDGLLEIYDEIDSRILSFKTVTGLKCIPHCRKCCETPSRNIEATVLEVIPLSIYLWQEGKAEFFLQAIHQADPETPCLLVDPDGSPEGCAAYRWRPTVCRLFGFSAVLNKQGEPIIALCKAVKKRDPGLENQIQGMIANGIQVPIYSLYGARASFLHPFLGNRYQINHALRAALETVGHRMILMGRA